MNLSSYKEEIEKKVIENELDLGVINAVMKLHYEGIHDTYRQGKITKDELVAELDRLEDKPWVIDMAVEYYQIYGDEEFACGSEIKTGKEIAEYFLGR